MLLKDYFSTGPAFERPIFDAVMLFVRSLGDVHVEPVSVGIFLKAPHKFCELRPTRKWVAVSFSLRRVAHHRLITRKVLPHGGRFWHVANVPTAADVDEDLLALIEAAYLQE
jgi:Domain of unknown function (DUF5655)